MLKTMSAAALSFLLAVGGGVAFAEGGGQAPSSAAPSSQSSGASAPRANSPRAMGFEEEEVQTAPWTVQRIDQKNHDLVLRAPDGTQSTVNIPAGTPGFDSLKKGDQIQLDYFEAAVVGVPANSASKTTQTGSGSTHAAANDTTNRQVRSIRKVGHDTTNGNDMEHKGNQPSRQNQ
jgi:hypothetical protein